MRTAKRILSYTLIAMMMLSMLTVDAGAISLKGSNIEASEASILAEQIISPTAVYVSDNCRVNFSAAMLGGSKIHFLLDGKKFHEFDVTDDTSMQTYSVNARFVDEIWGYRTFTAEKYDNTGKLLSSVSKSVKITTSNYEFMEVYPVQTGTPSTPIAGYDIRNTDDGLKYGYPRIEKATSEYAGTQNPYVFALNKTLSNGTLAYHDDDDDGKNDSIKATYTSNYTGYDSFLKNNIQLVQTSRNLLTGGGIIEIKFTLKLTEGNSSRMSLLGLPGWRNNMNGSQANYFVTLSKGNHFFTPGGVSKSFESCGINPTEWNTYKLQYDIDNEMWYFWINEGEANEYYSYSPKATSGVPTDSNTVAYSNGSKGIFIGHYMYPNETGNGGFTAKDFYVTRYKTAPQISEILIDGAPVTNGKISIDAQTITGTLSAAYDDITEDDVCFSVNGTEIDGGVFALSSDKTSFTYTIPSGTDIKDRDKVAFYIKGSAKIGGIPGGINQGFVLKAADPLIQNLVAEIDSSNNANLTVTIDRSKLTKASPLAVLCIYDNGRLKAINTKIITGSSATLSIPLSGELLTNISSCKAKFFLAEGESFDTDGDYRRVRLYEDIKW